MDLIIYHAAASVTPTRPRLSSSGNEDDLTVRL